MGFKYLLQDVKQLHASRSIHSFGVLSLLLASSTLAAETSPTSPQQGLLVLANGSILEGVVSHEGEKYRVMMPRGELQVRATNVDFFCHDMNEAYTRRRERRRVATADTHLEMARWCLQHGLLDQATAELDEARVLEPQLAQLKLLARQVEYLSRDKSQKNKPPSIVCERTATEIPSTDPTVPSSKFPQWARVEFVRRIQPMLVHNCASGGCHNPGSSQKMQVDREALSGIGNPELIQQNLDCVVRMVDLSDPEASSLLAHALVAHGTDSGEHSVAFTPRQATIMRAWMEQLTHNQFEEAHSTSSETLEDNGHEELDIKAARTVRNGAELDRLIARDPFDPELFNRERDPMASETSNATRLPKTPEPDLPLQEVP